MVLGAHALTFDHAVRLYEQGLTLLGDTADRPRWRRGWASGRSEGGLKAGFRQAGPEGVRQEPQGFSRLAQRGSGTSSSRASQHSGQESAFQELQQVIAVLAPLCGGLSSLLLSPDG